MAIRNYKTAKEALIKGKAKYSRKKSKKNLDDKNNNDLRLFDY